MVERMMATPIQSHRRLFNNTNSTISEMLTACTTLPAFQPNVPIMTATIQVEHAYKIV